VRAPARKRFGQHFLSDPRILARIADAALLGPGDTVIEIGPGLGTLTDALRSRAGRVIGIDVDRDLAAMLRARYRDDPHVSIVEGDVLKADLAALADGPFTLVGNIPYYITTPIVFRALEAPRARLAVFLVQREVAERMSASPNSKTYGALSVNLQAIARVEILFPVSAGAFRPPPTVESAVVRITPRDVPLVPPEMERQFQRFVRAAFGLRRKQMRRVVRTITGASTPEVEAMLERAEVSPDVRPEAVSVEGMVAMARELGEVRGKR
jgi:16S rRNA (adenine1518-N6/adenine1519-N6)-dimethyltransferase